jgi:hypothetical protein
MLVTSFITTARWGEVVDLMPEDTDWVAEDAG